MTIHPANQKQADPDKRAESALSAHQNKSTTNLAAEPIDHVRRAGRKITGTRSSETARRGSSSKRLVRAYGRNRKRDRIHF